VELTGSELLSRTRRLTNDTVAPYFISDAEMYEYLSEAERQLAAKGEVLRRTKAFTTTVGQVYVNVPALSIEYVQEITAVWFVNGARRKEVPYRGRFPVDFLDTERTGPPEAVEIGSNDTRMRVFPTPDEVYTLEVEYRGLPDEEITESSVPQVPARFHKMLPFGAAVLALAATSEEHYDASRERAVQGAWFAFLEDLYTQAQARYRNGGTVPFNGNGLW
jgi:hypothetical protein